MLNFHADWRFESPGPIPREVIDQFVVFINRSLVGQDQQDILEHFKGYFATAAGTTSSRSSSASWAETDLQSYMSEAGANAPMFIEAFYDACQSLPKNVARPSVKHINRILQEAKSGWEIRLPNLIQLHSDIEPIQQEAEEPATVENQAKELIQNSLSKSEKYRAEGDYRQAVSELLWLLETVSTVFRGANTRTGSVQGKYFNKIAADLQRHYKGQTLERVLEWVMSLHGYLSSPTGGGVRHGRDLNVVMEEMNPDDARLFCTLIRAYVIYLMSTHARLTDPDQN
jgi:hypothetical protein